MHARTSALVALALAACEGKPPRRDVTIEPVLDELRLRVPDGVVTTYDVSTDRWWLVSATDRAMLERAPLASIASPEALRRDLSATHWPRGTSITIASRESLSDGFTATFAVSGARETIVVRELGSRWLRCFGSVVLCKSVKRS